MPFAIRSLARQNSLRLLPSLAVLAIFASAASGHAASLIVDGGFESAGGGNEYFAGHSIDGGSWNVVTGAVFIDSGDPYVFAGNNSLNLTGVNPDTTNAVSQTFATVAGSFYVVNFWANADSPNTFSLLANGVAITGAPTSILNNGFPGPVTNSSLFTDYIDTFRATSNSTILTFSGVGKSSLTDPNQTGSILLDNVSVQVTPEPNSIVLLSTGVLGVALAAARKRLFSSAIAA